jgi:DNA-binding LytR/AlgR family response regulator
MISQKITALIVDDDAKSREVLEYHLRTIPEIEIIGSALGADEACRMLLEHVPDILFLDIEMPGKSGFDLLSDLRKLEIQPCIIFQTAFDKYAIEAIKNTAFDYLLKPVEREAILAALSRYKARSGQFHLGNQISDLLIHLNQHKKIRFNTRHGFIMIDPSDIIYCQADWSYTELWFSKEKKELVTMNIGKVEKILPESVFTKISRSILVNRNFIEKLDRKKRIITLCKDSEMFEFRVAGSMVKGI